MVPKNAVNSRTVSAICALPVIVAVLQAIAAKSTMPSTLLILRTFPPNRPKWVHFCRTLPHSAKNSPFPGIKIAGRERTLSGKMTPFLHFFPSEGAILSIQSYILTFYQSKHAKITTQASYQNSGGYMAKYADSDTRDGCTRGYKNGCTLHLELPQEPFIMSIRI